MTGDRFLAFVADGDAPADHIDELVKTARLRGLAPAFRRDRLCVLVDEKAASTVTDNGAGFIVGAAFPPRDSVAHAGFWGGFISFRNNDPGGAVEITRDPSGMIPCLFARQHSARWFFSDLEIALAVGLAVPAIDWTALARFLAYPHIPVGQTCLAGVEQLLPGMRLRLSRVEPLIRECAWSPWDHAGKVRRVDRYDDAVQLIRTETMDCVGAWASRSKRIMLELSGGLDSSIIAACLREHGAAFSCATFATVDPSGDERRHARQVASKLGVHLHELRLDAAGAPLIPRLRALTPVPKAASWRALIDNAVSGAIEEAGADVLFSGGGGDNVFCYLTTAAPAADALRAFGPGLRFARATRDVARLHRASVWRAARYAVRKACWAKPKLWPRNVAFLTPGIAPGSPPAHPWFAGDVSAPPGKIEQAASIASAVSVSDGGERNLPAPLCYPLLSRPLIETCLNIPTWMWVEGGRNRAVARDAFADLLPQEILVRRTKGDLTGLIAGIYREHRSEIETLLMEGRLASEGILDREAVSARMNSAAPFREAEFTHLVTLAAVEGWIQSVGACSADARP